MVYSKKAMEYFRHPKNQGEIKNADGVGKVGNVVCGDVMWLYIKVKNNTITDIKFRTMGCVAAIATSSMVTELAKGKTIEEALKITNMDVAKSLGGLPPVKMHCSVLAQEALNEAIYDYLKKNKKQIPEQVTKRHEHIEKELKSIEERYKEFVEFEEKVKKK